MRHNKFSTSTNKYVVIAVIVITIFQLVVYSLPNRYIVNIRYRQNVISPFKFTKKLTFGSFVKSCDNFVRFLNYLNGCSRYCKQASQFIEWPYRLSSSSCVKSCPFFPTPTYFVVTLMSKIRPIFFWGRPTGLLLFGFSLQSIPTFFPHAPFILQTFRQLNNTIIPIHFLVVQLHNLRSKRVLKYRNRKFHCPH